MLTVGEGNSGARTRLNPPDVLIIDDNRDLTAGLALWLRCRGLLIRRSRGARTPWASTVTC